MTKQDENAIFGDTIDSMTWPEHLKAAQEITAFETDGRVYPLATKSVKGFFRPEGLERAKTLFEEMFKK
jgi:hypothetical protein